MCGDFNINFLKDSTFKQVTLLFQSYNQFQSINFPTRIGKVSNTYFLLTYSMEQSPSWEANRFSASQEVPHILWNPKVHSQVPATCPYPEPAQSSPYPHILLPEEPS